MSNNNNYLLLVMATVRYDSYGRSNTPNFDKIGLPVKAHAPSCVSSGSMFFYLNNIGPITNTGRTSIVDKYPQWEWLSNAFRRDSNDTAVFTTLSDFYIRNLDTFHRGWNLYYPQRKDYTKCSDIFVDSVIKLINNSKLNDGRFYVLHVLDTHEPYADGDYIKSIEYVDKQFGRLLPYIKGWNVVITSDNGLMIGEVGDFFGDKKKMYDHRMTYISNELFRIPLIKGIVK